MLSNWRWDGGGFATFFSPNSSSVLNWQDPGAELGSVRPWVMFSPFGLPEGITLLITDALSAPANFLLHRTLAAHMKDRRDVKCIILSVSEDITRWKALAAKSVRN